MSDGGGKLVYCFVETQSKSDMGDTVRQILYFLQLKLGRGGAGGGEREEGEEEGGEEGGGGGQGGGRELPHKRSVHT